MGCPGSAHQAGHTAPSHPIPLCPQELLQEEPVERLDMELRQQAMRAIAAMSSAWLLSEKQKNGLLHACLSSVLHLPGYEDDMDPDMATYMELCFCFTGAAVFQHKCQENQRLPVLGKLAGHLILCCASTDERTRDEAMKAIHQIFTFITSP
ncbi:hypothetical protein CIB84_017677, partial [Bambusicola thoracicus]